MPRQPKPPAQRQSRDRRELALPSTPVADPPAPPAGLLPVSLEQWHTIWADPVAHLIRRTDVPRLVRYIRVFDELERVYARVGGNKRKMIRGSTKQLVVHPQLRQIPALSAELTTLEDTLGISEVGRRKLNIILPDEEQVHARSPEPQPLDAPTADPYEIEDDPRLYAIQGGQR